MCINSPHHCDRVQSSYSHVSKTNNTIQINGKTYDATTGEPVQAVPHQPAAAMSAAVVSHPKKTTHQPAQPVKHRQQQPATTLMRHAVKKPGPRQKPSLTAHGRADALTKQPAATIAPKLSIVSVDHSRLRHAKNVRKSKLVSRFSASVLSTSTPVTAVTPAPIAVAAAPRIAPAIRPSKSTADLLEHALRAANSHQQPAFKPTKSHRRQRAGRILGVSGAALAVLLLIGFLGYQNVGNVKLHLASSRAGFAAGLPSYRPAGFSLGDVNANPGQVAAHFHSNSDTTRTYTLTEQASAWDSNTLRDNFVSSTDSGYQTVQSHGLTIYLYNQGNATWVNHGIWYTIIGNGALGNQQLVDLASSL